MGIETGTAALIAGALAGGATVYQADQAGKEAKSAARDADVRAKAAAQELKDSQAAAASQAQAGLNARRRAQIQGSQSIYTSPLGLSGTANTTRKTLLGQ